MGEVEKADLLLSQNLIVMNGVTIPLQQGFSGDKVKRVHLADSYMYVLPAMTETIIDVFLERTDAKEEEFFLSH